MRTRTKVLLFAAGLGGLAAYGNYRFHASRYEPQCETLPGLCVYGMAPASSSVEICETGGFKEICTEGANITRRLDLAFAGERISLVGIYPPGQRTPSRVNIRASEERNFFCDTDGPVQVVVSPTGRFVMKGCREGLGALETYSSAYMGIRDIFARPSPIVPAFSPVGKAEEPGICSDIFSPQPTPPQPARRGRRTNRQEEPPRPPIAPIYRELCQTERNLLELSRRVDATDACRLENQRTLLIDRIRYGGEVRRMNDEIFRSRILAEEIESRPATVQAPRSYFWKGWDWILGLGVASVFSLVITRFARKKLRERAAGKSKVERLEADIEETLGKVEEVKEIRRKAGVKIMEDEKRRTREGMRKLFFDKLEEYYDRGNKAKTAEEMGEIWREFMDFEKKIRKDNPDLNEIRECREEVLRFEDFVRGRFSDFGIPRWKWR